MAAIESVQEAKEVAAAEGEFCADSEVEDSVRDEEAVNDLSDEFDGVTL